MDFVRNAYLFTVYYVNKLWDYSIDKIIHLINIEYINKEYINNNYYIIFPYELKNDLIYI